MIRLRGATSPSLIFLKQQKTPGTYSPAEEVQDGPPLPRLDANEDVPELDALAGAYEDVSDDALPARARGDVRPPRQSGADVDERLVFLYLRADLDETLLKHGASDRGLRVMK